MSNGGGNWTKMTVETRKMQIQGEIVDYMPMELHSLQTSQFGPVKMVIDTLVVFNP